MGGLSPLFVALEKAAWHTGPSDSTYSAYLIGFWAGRCLGRLNGRRRQRLGKMSSCAATRSAKITINLGPVVVSHLGSVRARLLAPKSRGWCGLDGICSHVFSSGEGNVCNPTSVVWKRWIDICTRLTLSAKTCGDINDWWSVYSSEGWKWKLG